MDGDGDGMGMTDGRCLLVNIFFSQGVAGGFGCGVYSVRWVLDMFVLRGVCDLVR